MVGDESITPTEPRQRDCHAHLPAELLTRTAVTAEVRRPHQLPPERPSGEPCAIRGPARVERYLCPVAWSIQNRRFFTINQ
jgi:hypothetical protein